MNAWHKETQLNKPQQAGEPIPVQSVRASSGASRHTSAVNLISGAGMSGLWDKRDTQNNTVDGSGMWLAHRSDRQICVEFDFGGTYPLGEMWVWNYNQSHPDFPGLLGRGLKGISLYSSLDGQSWTELKEEGFPYVLAPADGSASMSATNLNDGSRTPIRWFNRLARYVKIVADPDRSGHWGGYSDEDRCCGLSAVRFYAGSGLVVEPNEDWTELFHGYSGWTGADGIYSIALNGTEAYDGAECGKTLFVFGDTFIGEVDKAADYRLQTTMINNSLGLLQGRDAVPQQMEFRWNDSDPANPASSIIPDTPKSLAIDGSYYWLQDGACVNGTFYCFPIIIGPNLDGREGFQFKVHGVTAVAAPMTEDGPDLMRQTQIDTPLFEQNASGRQVYYGAAILPNTAEANVPNPDGYVYVYGLMGDDTIKRAVVARALPQHLTDIARWTFWNGSEWTADQAAAAPISGETSSEYSVTPIVGGELDGKYMLVYLRYTDTPAVAIHIGDSPVGPFDDGIAVYGCPESDEQAELILYNAKAHPHLSRPGELLISYNVNCVQMVDHIRNADIYHPRFVTLRQINEN